MRHLQREVAHKLCIAQLCVALMTSSVRHPVSMPTKQAGRIGSWERNRETAAITREAVVVMVASFESLPNITSWPQCPVEMLDWPVYCCSRIKVQWHILPDVRDLERAMM